MSRRLGKRFVLEREIGSGGMSTVYLGKDEVLDRVVAVKVLKPDLMESDIAARFRREGKTAARLSHPNIVRVYDAGQDDLDGETVSYIVMEHVSGGDLRDLIYQRGTLSAEEISNLSGIAAALAHAHERGVIHRDIKPHNILLTENGEPKLADFGIARALDATHATRTGTYMGTARYSSPEQLQGHETTSKSDIYSLGVTLYEAATGSPPFDGTPLEVASQHVSKPPTPLGEISQVDRELEDLILACLAKDLEDRPTATQVRDRLKEQPSRTGVTRAYAAAPAAEPATAQEDAGARRSAGPLRLSRWAPLLAALAALLVLLGIAGAFALLGGEDRQAQLPAGTTQEPAAGPVPEEQAEGQTTVEAPQASGPQPTAPEPRARPAQDDPPEKNSGKQAAARTVERVYKLAEAGEYARSYDLLSQNFKQTQAPTLEKWRNTFTTLQSIDFLQGPDAEVTGDTARVTAVTRAVHTDRTERNTAAWTLVLENGEWKLDSIDRMDRKLV